MLRRHVVFSGGWAHDFESSTAAFLELVDPQVETTVTDDLDELAALLEQPTDLFTVNACRFQMLDERYTEAQRSEFAMLTPPRTRAAIVGHLTAGRPMLALHTAVLCFDDWPEWPALIGGGWDWNRSWHPPPQKIELRFVDPDHPISAKAEAFSILDERYTNLVVGEGSTVLAVCPDEDGDQPALWCHEGNGARVAYSALGHDRASFEHPQHSALLQRTLTWLTER